MKQFLQQFLADESAASAIEYGLVASLIALVAVAGMSTLGTNLNTVFGKVATCLSTRTTAACT
ncbi:MAG: Flp family type IVb pilin [Betaproteobacteria bacterium]|jgi:pilus assembly protein Flp/PilA|nr:Flp family type IVb pilin [Betaproteobacteria bacterium]NBS46474.1 Flp family type IVb pilin [Betaproteobacteria bacterium]